MILGWLLLHRSVAVKLIMEAVSEARLDALGDVWVLPNGGDGEEDQLLQLRRLQGSGATSNISMQRQRPWAQSSGNDLLKPLQKTADTALRQLYGEDTARVAEYEIDELDTSSPSSLDVSPFQAPEAPSPRANSTDRQTAHLTPSGTGQRPVETLKAQPPPAQTSQSPQRRSQDQGRSPCVCLRRGTLGWLFWMQADRPPMPSRQASEPCRLMSRRARGGRPSRPPWARLQGGVSGRPSLHACSSHRRPWRSRCHRASSAGYVSVYHLTSGAAVEEVQVGRDRNGAPTQGYKVAIHPLTPMWLTAVCDHVTDGRSLRDSIVCCLLAVPYTLCMWPPPFRLNNCCASNSAGMRFHPPVSSIPRSTLLGPASTLAIQAELPLKSQSPCS